MLGIDQATLSRTQPVLQRDMVRVCACMSGRRPCATTISTQAPLAQHYEEYCPNAPAIDELGQEVVTHSSASGRWATGRS